MASYRLYCLDSAGRISLAEWIEAGDDAQALGQARLLKGGARKCEVWEGKRLVGRLREHDLSALQSPQWAEGAS